ncbi:hypothetical protein EDB83DRAFT_2309710 [Lactarius deliciosus]|nr:hypothetical protein EDB83DRAFT_2309710 [Lactarius deliciosus]
MAQSRGPEPLARALHTTLEGPSMSPGTPMELQNRMVCLWNPTSGTEIRAYSAHGYEVLLNFCFYLFWWRPISLSEALWDVTTGNTLRRILAHLSKINAVEFNADATVVASVHTGSYDSTPIQVLEEARDSVQALYVGSSRIMSGSVDGHVRTYDLRKGELCTTLSRWSSSLETS